MTTHKHHVTHQTHAAAQHDQEAAQAAEPEQDMFLLEPPQAPALVHCSQCQQDHPRTPENVCPACGDRAATMT